MKVNADKTIGDISYGDIVAALAVLYKYNLTKYHLIDVAGEMSANQLSDADPTKCGTAKCHLMKYQLAT